MPFTYHFNKKINNLHILQMQLERLGYFSNITYDGHFLNISFAGMLTEEQEILLNSYIQTYTEETINDKEMISLITTKQQYNTPNWTVICSFNYKGLSSQEISKLYIEAFGNFYIRLYDVDNHKNITTSDYIINETYQTDLIPLDTNRIPIYESTLEVQIKTDGIVNVKSVAVSG